MPRNRPVPPPTAAPSSKIPNSHPTSQGQPQGQPSNKLPPPPGVPEYGGTLPNGAPAAPGGGYDAMKPNGGQPQAPVLPPGSPGNGPIFPEDPVQPISYNGGYYNPTTAPHGMDMSAPGVAEQFWNNNQNLWFNSPQLDWVDSLLPQFNSPWFGEAWNQQNLSGIGAAGAGQQYWNGISGQANMMTPAEQMTSKGYQGPNNAQTAFNMTKGQLPGSLQPQFDKFYDRMADKAMSNVNSQAAARGVYGSNSALNNSIGAGLDVEAQRAKAATDFSLQDSQNQRAWLDSLAGQGRAADLSGQGAFDLNLRAGNQYLDRIKTFGDLAFRAEDMDFAKDKAMSDIAFGIDDQRLDRLGAGVSTAINSHQAHQGQLEGAFDAANITQNQREDRIDQLYNDVADMGNDVMSFFSENYDKLLGGDMAMNDQEIQAMIAQAADERGWSQQQQDRIFRDITGLIDVVTGDSANKEDQG